MQLWAIVAFIPAMVAGSIAHELTHAVAARLLGGKVVRISLLSLFVEYEMPADASTWRHRVVGLAPLIVGTLVAVSALVGGLIPSGDAFVVGGVAWAVFTLWGSLEDLSLAASRQVQDTGSSPVRDVPGGDAGEHSAWGQRIHFLLGEPPGPWYEMMGAFTCFGSAYIAAGLAYELGTPILFWGVSMPLLALGSALFVNSLAEAHAWHKEHQANA